MKRIGQDESRVITNGRPNKQAKKFYNMDVTTAPDNGKCYLTSEMIPHETIKCIFSYCTTTCLRHLSITSSHLNNCVNHYNESINGENINSTATSHLYIFKNPNRLKKSEYVPSAEQFSSEVNKILEQNIPFPYTRAELSRHKKSCINQFFCNPIIISYLARREVSVSEFGIPLYIEAERTVYDFVRMPHIPFRNPTLKRCPRQIGFFTPRCSPSFGNASPRTRADAICYEKLACAILGLARADVRAKKIDVRVNIPNYNAFHLLGIANRWIKLVLSKNKNTIEQCKNANPESHGLRGIHYFDKYLNFSKIIKLMNSIKSGEFTLEDINCNIFIFVFHHNGHAMCGVLLANRQDMHDNSIVFELFLFDSQKIKESEVLLLKKDFKISLGDDPLEDSPPSIPLTCLSYNLQFDGINSYEQDHNCVLYSMRTANKLVEIINSSQNSVLRARLLGHKGPGYIDTQEDIALYANELAQALPDFFDYNSESDSYTAKSFKDRQICNIAARWDLGRRFLKNYIRQYASDHQLPSPVFKLSTL